MDKEKSIDVLNTLIVINNDRIEGYQTASEETQEADLKDLFHQLIRTSEKNKSELIVEMHKLGGTPEEGTKTTGKIYRAWMDLKALVTGNERVSILNSCEYGEGVAIDTYVDALDDNLEDLMAEQQMMLQAQCAALKADRETVIGLRNMMETA
jgi:uncharacterized protein (TIGR02284 family)